MIPHKPSQISYKLFNHSYLKVGSVSQDAEKIIAKHCKSLKISDIVDAINTAASEGELDIWEASELLIIEKKE